MPAALVVGDAPVIIVFDPAALTEVFFQHSAGALKAGLCPRQGEVQPLGQLFGCQSLKLG